VDVGRAIAAKAGRRLGGMAAELPSPGRYQRADDSGWRGRLDHGLSAGRH
jgi:hypothetical protein